jgi:hypothetical protein
MQEPTLKFFQSTASDGVSLAAAGDVWAFAPIALPPAVVIIAGYLAVAGRG